MNLKFKDYLCLIVPVILVVYLYACIVAYICVLFNLSEGMQIFMCIVPTIIVAYPGINLMLKYFKWYDRHAKRRKKK